MNHSIEIKDVTAVVEKFEMNHLNLSIPKGVIVGVLGLNGAGKTTFFNALMGNHLMTKGDVIVLGQSILSDEMSIRKKMMMVQDVNRINPYAKAKFIKKQFKENYDHFDENYFLALQKTFQFPIHQRLYQMSLGMLKKFKLSLALACHPEILLLDEPLIGIDPIDKQMMIEHIQAFMENEGHTVLFSSHYVEDIEKIADYVLMIDQGQIKIFEEKEQLLMNYVLANPLEKHRNETHSFNTHELLMKKEEAIQQQLTYRHTSLESIFIHLVRNEVLK